MKLGCSSFSWQSQDDKHLLGRTCDIDQLYNDGLSFLPRGYEYIVNGRGDKMTSKYSLIGYSMMIDGAPIYIDGINEHGLAGCLLYYPGFAHYGDYRNDANNINPIYLLTHMLTQYRNLDELCTEVAKLNLIDETIMGGRAPVHFILSDRTGEAVVVEPDKGGLSIHRDTIGVVTNSPNYEWHKQNLRNYIGMQAQPRNEQQIGNYTVKPFGEGTGLLGLPGDYTPPSRFVKLAYLRQLVDKQADERSAVSEILNIFASVNIPLGVHKTADGRPEGSLYTSIMCNDSLIYYISTRTNHRLRAIDLNKVKDNTELISFDITGGEDIDWLV